MWMQVTSMVAVQYALHVQSSRLLDIQQSMLSNQSHGYSVSKDSHGFRRYHQSAVKLQRLNNQAPGWFYGTTEGIVDGQKVLVKTYRGQDKKEKKLVLLDTLMKKHPTHSSCYPTCRHLNIPHTCTVLHRLRRQTWVQSSTLLISSK
ncbi:hypothetical protein FA95DRAFT_1201712 [Auriscalpium vulgare]|uniref:Uncharacterized protein n=1 Tax=Auriscalpium vulgare TaxID=40419 RepID=A0ACB8R394_9AGAM|nr:hypothetical protein FA95DRAFT_1201712 [Auriscalpium vulgare]